MLITQQQVENIIGHKCLSSWEQGFIESIVGQMKKGRTLSENQERIVTRCLEKTSPENVASREEWEKEYVEQHRETALLCARYYKMAGYFSNLANAVLNDENYIPTREHYTKMCENKYAKKVIENVSTPFQFGLGDLARVRKTITYNHLSPADGSEAFHHSKMRNQAVIIIDQEDPKENPGQHKRVCCSVVTAPAIRFWCEERKLKGFKR
jgi:hypothetical protein